MALRAWFWKSTNAIRLSGVKDELTDTVITGATVEVTVLDAAKVAVAGETWPVTLPDQGSGLYQGKVAHTVAVNIGDNVFLEVVIKKDGNQVTAHIPLPVSADAFE